VWVAQPEDRGDMVESPRPGWYNQVAEVVKGEALGFLLYEPIEFLDTSPCSR
jgi:hypothetical protein